jgi:hypothetical protein
LKLKPISSPTGKFPLPWWNFLRFLSISMKKQVDLRQSPSVSVGFLNLQQHVDFSIFLLLLELTSLSLNFLSWLLLQPLLLSSSFSPLESSKMSVVRKSMISFDIFLCYALILLLLIGFSLIYLLPSHRFEICFHISYDLAFICSICSIKLKFVSISMYNLFAFPSTYNFSMWKLL